MPTHPHTRATRGPLAALVAAAVCLITACTGSTPFGFSRTVAGTPVAAPPPISGASTAPGDPPGPTDGDDHDRETDLAPGVQLMPGQAERIAEHAAARRIDPCALHNPAIVTAVTRLTGDSIMPDRTGLHTCTLEAIADAWDLPAWSLKITVGADFAEHHRTRAVEETIDGVTVWRENNSTGSDPDEACTYLKPLGEHTAIELRVRRGGGKPRPESPCQIATEYLGQVLGFWKNPAHRGDALSVPGLRLADVDPCLGVAAAATKAGLTGMAAMSTPYSCSMTPTPGPAGTSSLGDRVLAELRMETDPALLLTGPGAEDYTAVTVGGRPGVTTQDDITGSPRCQVIVSADPDTPIIADHSSPNPQQHFQTVTVQAADCVTATTAADAILAALD
jgi:hypothetical protein